VNADLSVIECCWLWCCKVSWLVGRMSVDSGHFEDCRCALDTEALYTRLCPWWSDISLGYVCFLSLRITLDKLSYCYSLNLRTLCFTTGWSKKMAQSLCTIILQLYMTESCSLRQNVRKEILYMT